MSSAIQFLASVADKPAYKQLFADTNTLTGICEKVIVPNMEFRGVCVCVICLLKSHGFDMCQHYCPVLLILILLNEFSSFVFGGSLAEC